MKTGIYWQDPEYPAKGMDFIFDPSLVLYLPLHRLDGASFMSKDAYGHLCTVTGALWTPRGRSFDGSDDYIDCGNKGSLEITGAITIELWLNPPSAFTKNETLVSKVTGGTQDINLYYYHAGGYFIFVINGVWCLRLAATELTYGAWNHLVFTIIDGTTNNHAFLNGIDKATNQNAPTMTSGTSTLYIGSYIGTGEFFTGLIGEVRIYRRALTPLEAQHNYLATKWRYQ